MLSQPNQETQLGQRPRGAEIESYLRTKHRREARQLSLMGFLDLGGLMFAGCRFPVYPLVVNDR